MWFFNPDSQEVYWLSQGREGNEDPPQGRIPFAAVERAINTETEYLWDRLAGERQDGWRMNFSWYISTGVEVARQPEKEFPKTVTLENLAKLFGSILKKSETITLDKFTTLQRNLNSFHLYVDGVKTISWVPFYPVGQMVWNSQGYLTQHQVDSLNKYLGSTFKLVEKDGIVGLETEKAGWVPVSPHVIYSVDGSILNANDYHEFMEIMNTAAKRMTSMVDKYIGTLTTTKVITATQGMNIRSHPIITRCDGCQSCNGIHLEVHMARGDLDAYLIYAAYDAFGPETVGGPLRNTWDLIEDPTKERVEAFKEIMRKFLVDALRQKIPYATFMPMTRRQGAMARWQLYAHHRLMLDGDRVAPGRRENANEDGLRDGEWLAQEILNQQHKLRRRYPAGRLEEDWGLPLAADEQVPDAWEADPYDVNMDLEEEA